MLSINPSALRDRANNVLQNAVNPKKLVLLHTSVALGSTLLVTVVNMLLNLQIAGAGGLSGIGLRSILSTIQSILEFFVMIGLPFWEIGIIFVALRWSREEEAGAKTLLRGFLRVRSVLGLNLLRGLIFALIGAVVFYLGATIFMLTPMSEPLLDVFEPMLNGNMTSQEIEAYMTPERIDTVVYLCWPMLAISGVLYAGIAIPLFYRLRLAEYVLADGTGARKSLAISLRLTRKKCMELFKVDLHFWWYYLVLLLLSILSFVAVLLDAFGVILPLSAEVCTVIFYLLATVGQIAFCFRYQATTATTYALVYRNFSEELPEQN